MYITLYVWMVSRKSCGLNAGTVTSVNPHMGEIHIVIRPPTWKVGRSAIVISSLGFGGLAAALQVYKYV